MTDVSYVYLNIIPYKLQFIHRHVRKFIFNILFNRLRKIGLLYAKKSLYKAAWSWKQDRAYYVVSV